MKRLSEDFLEECNKRFKKDPVNAISRNVVTSVGAILSSTDSNCVNEVNHIFMNSVKRKDLKCTNQGYSGRCWMYSGLNIFRHAIINGMGIDNFEFSETYLFFYDKLEMANTFLQWNMDNLDRKVGDRDFDYVLQNSMQDGGWWHCFVNLVNKYGLIPKDAMKETCHSSDSSDMNSIIVDKLHSAASWMRKNRKKSMQAKRDEVMEDVYRSLVLFLGEPPSTFSWSFTTDEGESTVMNGLTPKSFKEVVMSGIDLDDFVSLTNMPIEELEMDKMYAVTETNNVYEGGTLKFLNTDIRELSKAAKKSVVSGFPVWFSADVRQCFHPWHSTLDDKLLNFDSVFGKLDDNFDKGARMDYQTTAACHAMTITGVNIRENGSPVNWQIENSWGYVDNQTPGQDGWLSMSDSWFDKYVTEVVVHKNFLSRSLQRKFDQKPVYLNPWDFSAPAVMRVDCVDAPEAWRDRVSGKN
jgi:bleomycin hydrolase